MAHSSRSNRGDPHSAIRVVDLPTHRVKKFTIPPGGNDAALSPDGTKIAVVGDVVSVIDPETGEVVRRADPGSQDFTSVSWSPDGRYVAMGGWHHEVPV